MLCEFWGGILLKESEEQDDWSVSVSIRTSEIVSHLPEETYKCKN
jgi:hypothetical protein